MSIWSDCREYDALPFFGFPVKPDFRDGIITFEFPLGYTPNGSKTEEVAKKLQEMFGGDIIEVTDTIVKVRPDNVRLGNVFYDYYMGILP